MMSKKKILLAVFLTTMTVCGGALFVSCGADNGSASGGTTSSEQTVSGSSESDSSNNNSSNNNSSESDSNNNDSEMLEKAPSEGLEYELFDDVMEYDVIGIGECEDLDVVIPSTYQGLPVRCIADYAFAQCEELTSITIPDSVTYIGDYAFAECEGLTSITIPDSVTYIGEGVFYRSTGLTSIEVSEKNTVYHSSGNCLIETESGTLLAGCNTSVIPNDGSIKYIAPGAFEGVAGLTSVVIPDSVTIIQCEAFEGCIGLTSVTIGNGVTTIEADAFGWCTSLTSLFIPESVTSIDEEALPACESLTSIEVDENNTVYHSAGNCLIETESKILVAGCKTSVIPSDGSVTTIGEYAFYGCSELKSVTIPECVTTIGGGMRSIIARD